MSIAVHAFGSTVDAYTAVNTGIHHWNDDVPVKDGDVLVVPSEGVVGIAVGAWPVAIVFEDRGAFHTVERESTLAAEYAASITKAVETAVSDADITGNDHWKDAK